MSESQSEGNSADNFTRRKFLQSIALAGAAGASGLALAGTLIPPARAAPSDADVARYIIVNEPPNVTAYYGNTGTFDKRDPDPATVIQYAIDNIQNRPGAIVFIKKDSYQITTPIELKNGVRLYSDGALLYTLGTESIWSSYPGSGHRGILQTSNISDVIVEGLKLDARGNACAFTSFGHSNLRFHNCDFTSTTSSGPFGGLLNFDGQASFGISNMKQTIFDSCYFHDTPAVMGRAFHLYPSNGFVVDGFWVEKCTFENVGGNAINLDAYDLCKDIHIVNNRFLNLTQPTGGYASAVFGGLAVPDKVYNLKVIGNYYLNTLNNIQQVFVAVYSSHDIQIIGNTARALGTGGSGACFAPGRVNNPDTDLLIQGNYVEGFDAFWDPDSMVRAEVSGNTVVNSGQGISTGYGTQQFVHIHDNTLYNSFNSTTYPVFLLMGATDPLPPLKVLVERNLYVDDRTTSPVTYAIELTGGGNFGDVIVRHNRFYLPNKAFTRFIKLENQTEVLPRQLLNNERHDSLGVKFVEGVAPIPVTASPFTYVNTDSVPEAVYIFGGSVNQVAKNSINLFTNTNVTVWLEPDESVTVSYSTTPSMAKDRK